MGEQLEIAGLPYFAGSAAPPPPGFEPGGAFWKAIEQLAAGDELAGRLDALLAGGPAPRTWLLLHEPGQAAVGAVAALMLARALCARGQNVVVLDVDEAGAELTAWAGRRETEGWIDIARFGASVHGAGAAMPFRGGRGTLLGVGSFAPTDASEDEVISLVARLRHQADDVIMVGAVGPDVLPWARRAERRLFCWDRSARGESDLGPVLAPFAAEGVPLTGLLGWGPTAVAPAAKPAPGAVSARDQSAAPAAPDTAAATEPTAKEPAAREPVVSAPAPAPTAPPSPPTPARATAPAPAAPRLDELAPLDGEPEPSRGTHRAFWIAAAVFGAALACVAWYWSNYVRVPPGGYFEPVVTQSPASRPVDGEPGPAAAPDSSAPAQPANAQPVAEAAGLASIGDSLPSAADTGTGGGAAAVSSPAAPPASPAESPATSAFDPAAYAAPVGRDGWALHVYSLADSASAARQVAQLEGEGIRAAVRIVEIREKGGRWWRVYVGSFPSRRAAAEAMPALLGRLKADWAEPARIQ